MHWLKRRFEWEALDNHGNIIKGQLFSFSLKGARHQLLLARYKPIHLSADKKIYLLHPRSISLKTLANFFKQLSTLFKTNISLMECVRHIYVHTSIGHWKNILSIIIKRLESGFDFATSLEEHPKLFSSFICQTIRFAENTGTLSNILEYLNQYYQEQFLLKKRFAKALFYPALVTVISLGVLCFLLLAAIPQFADFFSSFNEPLPSYTQFLLNTANFFQHYFWFYLPTIVLLTLAYHIIKNKCEDIREKIEFLKLKIPFWGELRKSFILFNYLQCLDLSTQAGLPVHQAIYLANQSFEHPHFKRLGYMITHLLQAGHTVAYSLYQLQLFSPLACQILESGEASSRLEEIFSWLCTEEKSHIHHLIDHFLQLLEPICILIIGILVGGIVVGLYLPIFKLGNAV